MVSVRATGANSAISVLYSIRPATVVFSEQARLAPDTQSDAKQPYYQALTATQLAGIQAVAMDILEPFIAATHEHVAEAAGKIVFDRFHIMTHMTKAVDDVRKAEHRHMQAAGDNTLKRTKYFWLFSEENLPEHYAQWFTGLKTMHLKTGRAWAIKESLRDLGNYQRKGWAERHWKKWYFWATHSALPPVVKAAHTANSHLANVLTYFARLLEKNLLAGVEPHKGKFRTFLLAGLRNFLANERDRPSAGKRGGGRAPLSLDFARAEHAYNLEPHHALTPDKLFEHRWAIALLDGVGITWHDGVRRELRQGAPRQLVMSYLASGPTWPAKSLAIQAARPISRCTRSRLPRLAP